MQGLPSAKHPYSIEALTLWHYILTTALWGRQCHWPNIMEDKLRLKEMKVISSRFQTSTWRPGTCPPTCRAQLPVSSMTLDLVSFFTQILSDWPRLLGEQGWKGFWSIFNDSSGDGDGDGMWNRRRLPLICHAWLSPGILILSLPPMFWVILSTSHCMVLRLSHWIRVL